MVSVRRSKPSKRKRKPKTGTKRTRTTKKQKGKKYNLLVSKPYPLVIAHRGSTNGTEFKENTLDAIKHAKKIGSDGYEIDVRITKDNKVILHHNPMMFDGIKPVLISTHTYNELKKIDKDLTLLDEVIPYVGKDQLLMIEVKSFRKAKTLIKKINQSCKPLNIENVWLRIKWSEQLAITMSDDNKLNTATAILSMKKSKKGDKEKFDIEMLSPNYFFSPAKLVKQRQDDGFFVTSWTVNNNKSISKSLMSGIDAFMTDNVEEAIKIRNKMYKTARTEKKKLDKIIQQN